MGRESIEEGELSTPLVAKDHQLYGSGASSGDHACANTTSCDDGGESQSGSSSATGLVGLSTLVAVSGSYVFGTTVGYSSSAQSGITDDLGLTVAEVGVKP
nr:sugar transporter erd6 [Quercus suber]